jgi:hypothetical protein
MDFDQAVVNMYEYIKSQPGNRISEEVSINDYSIDGKETGTFLYEYEESNGITALQKVFLFDDDNKIYTLSYIDIKNDFYSP